MDDFKVAFENAYQAIFNKVLVAKEVASTRLEPKLTWGAAVDRPQIIVDGVRVQDVVDNTNYTIHTISDTKETLTVNKEKATVFRIPLKHIKQAGPLSPAEKGGYEMALKVARYVDADVFAEVKNASQTFDTGDLTTMTSNGTPITLSTTNVPQLAAQAPAKLRRDNQDLTNMVWVLDSYAASIVEQYVMSKNIDLAGAAFKNGYAGPVHTADLYVSENLMADAVITMTANPTAGQTFSINGYVYTFVSSIGSTAGNVLLEAGVDATRDNLVDAIHQASGTAGTKYVAWTDTAPNFTQSKWLDLRLAAVDSDAADTITITGTGSGRLIFGGTATYTVTKNYIHSYFGMRGGIDLVVQDQVEGEFLDDPYQFAKIVRSRSLYALKTFADGKRKFLDVQIASV